MLAKQFKTDAYGGIAGEYELPSDAQLGVYQLYVVNHGGGNFRVEEYKKPEFEVKIDAPTEPVMLGEKIKATIKAKYYFGSPVVKAKVQLQDARTSFSQNWYPPAPWDWFYGKGYWWFGYDYAWYPGWSQWGCRRPIPWWIGRGYNPPEVVADAEVPIGPDGTVLGRDRHGRRQGRPSRSRSSISNHRRSDRRLAAHDRRQRQCAGGPQAVSRDRLARSRLLSHGRRDSGALRRPHAGRQARAGQGHLVLYKISYDAAGKPSEKAVEEWNVDTNAQGRADKQFKAAAAGQYRLAYKLTDAEKHTIEGGYVFAIVGPQAAAGSFRFNELELVPDRREYKPGDTVKLMVNTNRAGGIVWLFIRPANGVYLPPKLLRPAGKSRIVDIGVTKKDMPNFFVEALTIADGRTYTDVKEIVVPPEKRVLSVAVQPSRETYKPGQKATVQVKLTDSAGKPFVGSTVVAIYDKAVEYISGGSNVPEIKAFFWKWRRSHYLQMETNLGRSFYNLLKSGETAMNDLGVFGNLTAEAGKRMEGTRGPIAHGARFGARCHGARWSYGQSRRADGLRSRTGRRGRRDLDGESKAGLAHGWRHRGRRQRRPAPARVDAADRPHEVRRYGAVGRGAFDQ